MYCLTVQRCLDSTTSETSNIFCGEDRLGLQSFCPPTHHGCGQGMVAENFDSDGHTEQFIFSSPIEGDDIGETWFSLGQCASLIKGNGVDPPQVLQWAAPFHENSTARSTGHTTQHRTGGRNRQGTGTRRNQDRHRSIERLTECRDDHKPGKE